MKTNQQVELFIFRDVAGTGEREYLLLHRVAAKGGFWQPMTGGNHVGETLEQTVRREAFEELGIQLGDIIFTNYTFTFSDHGKDYVEYVYGAKVSPDTEIKLSPEHDEYRWVTVEEAKSLLKWDTNKKGLEALCELLRKTPIF